MEQATMQHADDCPACTGEYPRLGHVYHFTESKA